MRLEWSSELGLYSTYSSHETNVSICATRRPKTVREVRHDYRESLEQRTNKICATEPKSIKEYVNLMPYVSLHFLQFLAITNVKPVTRLYTMVFIG